MLNSGKDAVTAHLDKSIISNILSGARASLKEPSRPFTPGDTQRALFTNQDANRPPSSYSIRAMSKELEPLKQKPTILDQPMQVISSSRRVPSEERKSSSRKPVKVIQETIEEKVELENETLIELKNLISVLEKMKIHSEVRQLYQNNDLDVFLTSLTECLATARFLENKPAWASCEEVLKILALAFENFEDDVQKIMKLGRCLLENIINHELLYKKTKKTVVVNSIAASAIKVLYQFSKKKEYDSLFVEENLHDTIYKLFINIIFEDTYLEIDLPYDFLIFVLGTLKNLSNFSGVSNILISLISPLSSLLPTPLLDTKPHQNSKHGNLLVQVIGLLKNITSKTTLQDLLASQVIEKIVLTMQIYKDQEIVLNSLKCLSKISLEEIVCNLLQEYLPDLYKACIGYDSPSIICQAGYIMANIFTVTESSRKKVEKNWVLQVLNICVKYIGNNEIIHVDLLVKIVRLIANMVSAPHVGEGLDCCEFLTKALCEILTRYSIETHEELILNTVACMTNLLYYDIPNKNYISPTARLLAFSKLSPLLVSSFNEEVTSETLRALGNLTRHEAISKELPQLHMIDIFFMLLDHSNWHVLYYTLGCLINVSSLSKDLIYSEKYFDSLISILDETQIYEPELTTQLFMILSNLCSLSKGMVPWEGVAGEENVKKLSLLVKSLVQEAEEVQNSELDQFIKIGKSLKDLMPKPLLPCPVEGCGRKFATSELLEDHWNRRHK